MVKYKMKANIVGTNIIAFSYCTAIACLQVYLPQ